MKQKPEINLVNAYLNERKALCEIGRLFYVRGWSVGTSSNYSIRVKDKPAEMLITASGKDKRCLSENDFVLVDAEGELLAPHESKPSAETLLHTSLYAKTDCGAVLHTHSIWSTLLSDVYARRGYLEITGYEMLKGLEGISTHDTSVIVKIFENSQDMTKLSLELEDQFDNSSANTKYGFLLEKHGLYTWGKDLFTARRHVEILEFLFEVIGRRLSLGRL